LIDPYGIIQLRIWLNFAGILLGWFAFYFLIGALKSVEEFTKKKTDWKLIYFSLPFLLILPIAELHSYYVLGQPLTGLPGLAASALFAISSCLLLIAIYSLKQHLGVKLVLKKHLTVAFFLFFASSVFLVLRITEFNSFINAALLLAAFFFFAISIWVVGSYTKQFNTIYPMPDLLVTASLLLLVGQLIRGYSAAGLFTGLQNATMLSFLSTLFFFIALLIAAMSTYVFKKTVIEFSFNAPPAKLKKIKS